MLNHILISVHLLILSLRVYVHFTKGYGPYKG